MILDNIFINYVAHEKLNLNLEELTAYCYENKKRNKSVYLSNSGGWSGDLNLQDKELQPLIKCISELSIDLMNNFNLKENLVIQNIWTTINQKSDYNYPHLHPGSIISGSFYIKTPKNCGDLIFLNPNSTVCFFEKYFDAINPLIHSRYHYTPEENVIYMFPSWMQHYVEPNHSNEDRIAMIFNIGVMK